MHPYFSIVIPSFNRVELLKRSINSVLQQSFSDFEIIIIDNGSTDNTKEWIQNKILDKRVHYHYQNGTGSPANPRNKGLSISKGNWICFLDSDDFWKKTKLEKIYKVINSDEAIDIVCHNEKLFHDKRNNFGRLLKYGPASKKMYEEMLIIGNRLSTSATAVKRTFIKSNNLFFNELEGFAMVEDYDLWLNIARLNAKFHFIRESLGFYSISDSNMIGDSSLYCENLRNLLKFHTFDIQTFENDKYKLWRLMKVRLRLLELSFSEKNLFSRLVILLNLFIKSPINLLKFVIFYLKVKFTNIF